MYDPYVWFVPLQMRKNREGQWVMYRLNEPVGRYRQIYYYKWEEQKSRWGGIYP